MLEGWFTKEQMEKELHYSKHSSLAYFELMATIAIVLCCSVCYFADPRESWHSRVNAILWMLSKTASVSI